MRLKYQLRGLGIGIILTAALLMIFSDDEKSAVKADNTVVMAETEEEVTEALTKESEVEESNAIEESSIMKESSVAEESSITEESSVVEESSITEETSAIEESVSEEETEKTFEELSTEIAMEETVEETSMVKSTEAEIKTGDVAKVKIVSGDDSGTVARKLQTAGLIENASEFDAFLMQHGYDKRISVGEVEIELGSTWLEIAEKIAR